ncbi:hypothetical protein FACS1894126_2730 [Alphaproteobacteria bacterium]|nr:hypothetical protein FACS1894126_2730 [Alphaproteobacteria bacterium]
MIYHAEDVGVKEWHDAVHLWLDYVPRSEVFPEFTFEAIMTSCVPDVRLTLKLRTTELTPECTSLAYAKTFLALGVLASNIEPKKRRFSLIDTTMLTLRCPASNVTAGMYKKEHPSEPYGSDWSKQAKLDDIVDSLKPVALKLLD